MRHLFLAAAAALVWTAAATAAPAFPVTLTHKYGTTTLTQAPKRVVAIGLTDQDPLIALGTVPVATREWFGQKPGALFPWARDRIGSTPLPQVLAYELNYEAIAALNPDLIVAVCSGLTREEYATLSKIAPTVAQPGQFVDWGAPWQVSTRTMGAVLGKAAEAEALIAGVEKKFADARKAHPAFAGKRAQVATPWGWPTSYYAYGSQDVRVRILQGLGFTPLAEVDKLAGTGFGASISRERLNLMDLDAVLWLVDSPAQEKSFRADPVWAQLKAAREGRDGYLTDGTALYDEVNFSTVLSLPRAIDDLVPLLEKLVDGNPATR